MQAEILKPQVIRPERVVTPQCDAEVNEPYPSGSWRKDRYSKLRPHFDPGRCQHESVFLLDGHHFCKKHAGIYCLEKWLSGGLRAVEATDTHPEGETLAGEADRPEGVDFKPAIVAGLTKAAILQASTHEDREFLLECKRKASEMWIKDQPGTGWSDENRDFYLCRAAVVVAAEGMNNEEDD